MSGSTTPLIQGIQAGDAHAVATAERLIRDDAPGAHGAALRRALTNFHTHGAGMRRPDHGASHLSRDYDAALRHARVLMSTGENTPQDTLRFFSLLLHTGRMKEAEAALAAELAGLPDPSAEYALHVTAVMARLQYKLGHTDDAASLYARLIEQATRLAGASLTSAWRRFIGIALARLARIRINTGNPQGALDLIDRAPHRIELDALARTRARADALVRHGPIGRPGARPVTPDTLSIVCVKHGRKYGPEYVNRLHAMLRRHQPGAWQFVCITDDPTGLDPAVDVIDISTIKVAGWWTKIAMFDPRIALRHDTVLYLDLDTVVVGPLEFLDGLTPGFHIFEHPDAPCFNSSIMLFDRPLARPLFERITARDIARLPGDQEWIEECMPNAATFPPGAISLYRGLEPDTTTEAITRSPTRIVTFPANPKPHQIRSGWVKALWV